VAQEASRASGNQCELFAFGPFEQFAVSLRISLIAAVIVLVAGLALPARRVHHSGPAPQGEEVRRGLPRRGAGAVRDRTVFAYSPISAACSSC
jgi:hypothetical protein